MCESRAGQAAIEAIAATSPSCVFHMNLCPHVPNPKLGAVVLSRAVEGNILECTNGVPSGMGRYCIRGRWQNEEVSWVLPKLELEQPEGPGGIDAKSAHGGYSKRWGERSSKAGTIVSNRLSRQR